MQKFQKFLVKIFLCYSAAIMDLTNNSKLLSFPFSDILPGNVSTSKILFSSIRTSGNKN